MRAFDYVLLACGIGALVMAGLDLDQVMGMFGALSVQVGGMLYSLVNKIS